MKRAKSPATSRSSTQKEKAASTAAAKKRARSSLKMADPAPSGLASPPCSLAAFADWAPDAAAAVPAGRIQLKRAYEAPSPEDGPRFLVDRLWPRGVKKEALALTAWLKDVAPSAELRKWFGHDPARWQEFRQRYTRELRANEAALRPLRDAAARGPLTLVYGAHDHEHNQAVVLREFLSDHGHSA